jgi:hypothetical protein
MTREELEIILKEKEKDFKWRPLFKAI